MNLELADRERRLVLKRKEGERQVREEERKEG